MEKWIVINGVRKMLLFRTDDEAVFVTYDNNALGNAYTVYAVVDGRPKPYMWFNTAGEAYTYWELIKKSKERRHPYE